MCIRTIAVNVSSKKNLFKKLQLLMYFVSLLVFRQNKKGEVGVHRQDGNRET